MKKFILFLTAIILAFTQLTAVILAEDSDRVEIFHSPYGERGDEDIYIEIIDLTASTITFNFHIDYNDTGNRTYFLGPTCAELIGNTAYFTCYGNFEVYMCKGKLTIYDDCANIYIERSNKDNEFSPLFLYSETANSDYSVTIPSVENIGATYRYIQNPSADTSVASNISIYLNGKPLSCPQAPYLKDGVTMVPMRVIFEALGAEVTYNETLGSIHAEKKNTKVFLNIGSKAASIKTESGYQNITLQKVPIILNGTTMIPLRFAAEALNATVSWNDSTRTITIDKN